MALSRATTSGVSEVIENEAGDCGAPGGSPREMVFHNSRWEGADGGECLFLETTRVAVRMSEKDKGCDIGYALATSSCEGANSVETCTVTAF